MCLKGQLHSSPKKCSSKQYWDPISPQSEWQSSEKQTVSAGEVWKTGSPYSLLVGGQTNAPTTQTSMEASPEAELGRPYDPAVACPITDPANSESTQHRDAWPSVFPAAWLIAASLWDQPRYPTAVEHTEKMQYLHTLECCLPIENEAVPLAGKQIQLETITLHEFKLVSGRQMSYVSSRLWFLDFT